MALIRFSQWADVPGFEGLYRVSSCGQVLSMQKTIRGPQGYRVVSERYLTMKKKDGYHAVQLCREGKKFNFRVSVLVLKAFRGPRPDGFFGLHWDDDGFNNDLGNLRWGTQSDNSIDSYRNGRLPPSRKRVERSDGKIYESASAAARDVGDTQGNISRACRSERPTAKGYRWRYV